MLCTYLLCSFSYMRTVSPCRAVRCGIVETVPRCTSRFMYLYCSYWYNWGAACSPLLIVPYISYFVRFVRFHGVKQLLFFSLEGPKTEKARYLNQTIKSAWYCTFGNNCLYICWTPDENFYCLQTIRIVCKKNNLQFANCACFFW